MYHASLQPVVKSRESHRILRELKLPEITIKSYESQAWSRKILIFSNQLVELSGSGQ